MNPDSLDFWLTKSVAAVCKENGEVCKVICRRL